jgi:hypothetical protein
MPATGSVYAKIPASPAGLAREAHYGRSVGLGDLMIQELLPELVVPPERSRVVFRRATHILWSPATRRGQRCLAVTMTRHGRATDPRRELGSVVAAMMQMIGSPVLLVRVRRRLGLDSRATVEVSAGCFSPHLVARLWRWRALCRASEIPPATAFIAEAHPTCHRTPEPAYFAKTGGPSIYPVNEHRHGLPLSGVRRSSASVTPGSATAP